jgi:hypothetical protein
MDKSSGGGIGDENPWSLVPSGCVPRVMILQLRVWADFRFLTIQLRARIHGSIDQAERTRRLKRSLG